MQVNKQFGQRIITGDYPQFNERILINLLDLLISKLRILCVILVFLTLVNFQDLVNLKQEFLHFSLILGTLGISPEYDGVLKRLLGGFILAYIRERLGDIEHQVLVVYIQPD